MALKRPKRNNAGNRMSKLIEEHVDEESEDNIYNTLYGGFKDEENDGDYVEEEQEEDVVDSDFSLSEHDNDEEEMHSEDEKKKRKRNIMKRKPISKDSKVPTVKMKRPLVKKTIQPFQAIEKGARMRATTILKGQEVAAKSKFQNVLKRHPTMPQMRRLTQEELLAEARITEEKNLASLAQFLKIEAEKKANKAIKTRYRGPIIRFHSTRMPVVNENKDDESKKWCSRNFLEFTDTKNFPKEYFPGRKVKYSPKALCVVTGQPAKYKDPLTGLPYATLEAFKYIRRHRKRIIDEMIAKRDSKKRKKYLNSS